MALYAQTSGTLSTNSGSFTPMKGLSLTIPEGVGIPLGNAPQTVQAVWRSEERRVGKECA